MKCLTKQELVELVVLEDMDDGLALRMMAHLDECNDCNARYGDMEDEASRYPEYDVVECHMCGHQYTYGVCTCCGEVGV